MIDEIVNYCHEQYQNKPLFCENCDEYFCNKGCKQCLHDIHFTQDCHRNYDCPYMCYYYVCQNIHRYATEMAWIWNDLLSNFAGNGKLFGNLNICSIGCGPCSELIALEEYCLRKPFPIIYSFVGFDTECTWNDIQNVVKNNTFNPAVVSFEHTDVFRYYDTHDKPNVIILNYVLSSIAKNNPNSVDAFINSVCILFKTMGPGAIILNDINHFSARNIFYKILIKTIQDNQDLLFQQYYFNNTIKACIPYGSCRGNSSLWLKPNNFIQLNYSTNTECHSAQMIIIKK